MIRSLCESNTEALSAIQSLHCPAGFDADISYGNGSFWKSLTAPALKFDVDPQVDGVIRADSGDLPVAAGSLRSIVFDPPFLTYVRAGRSHKDGKVAMTARFGGYYTYAELELHYRRTLHEAQRVLVKGGVLTFKCQDIVHNHRLHCTHANVIAWAADAGLRLVDLFVLAAKSRMPGPQKGQQRHARVWHSYFLVFRK